MTYWGVGENILEKVRTKPRSEGHIGIEGGGGWRPKSGRKTCKGVRQEKLGSFKELEAQTGKGECEKR